MSKNSGDSLLVKLESHKIEQKKNVKRSLMPARISHTAVFLIGATIIMGLLSLYVAPNSQLDQDPLVSNFRLAILTITVISIILSMLYLPDGLIIRPSQLLWKGVTGFTFVYLIALIVFLFLDKQQTQQVLSVVFDRSLGVPLPEKSYAGDCRLYIPNSAEPFKNIQSSLDIFIWAHLVGWFVKTLICRDLKLVLFQSVFFELLEVMWRHYLPNFYECWWDHAILDVMGMNLLGIMLGWWVIKRYHLQRLKWSLREGPLKRTFLQNTYTFFTEGDVSQVQYKALTTTKKFLQVSWFIIFMPLADLCFFFNKFILNIPPAQYINTLRVWMMGLLCINASKQYYAYITRKDKEMRVNALLAQLIVLFQIILFIKNYNGQFDGIAFPIQSKILISFFLGFFTFCLGKVLYSDYLARKRQLINSN